MVTAKAIATAAKEAIAGTKALIAAIAAGGWVAVIIIILICAIGMVFAFFSDGQGSEPNIPSDFSVHSDVMT